MHCSRWSLLVVGVRPLGGATVFHYVGLRAFGVYYCSHVGHHFPVMRAYVCRYIVQLGLLILCMLEFCFSLYAGYGTIHIWSCVICLMISVCSIVLCPVVSKLL